jgi:hypothetical protein
MNREHNILISSGWDVRACDSCEFDGFHPSRERNICTIVIKSVYGTLNRLLNLIASGCDGLWMLGLFNTFMPNTECHALGLWYFMQFLFFLGQWLSSSDASCRFFFLLAASKQCWTASNCDCRQASSSSSSWMLQTVQSDIKCNIVQWKAGSIANVSSKYVELIPLFLLICAEHTMKTVMPLTRTHPNLWMLLR